VLHSLGGVVDAAVARVDGGAVVEAFVEEFAPREHALPTRHAAAATTTQPVPFTEPPRARR